MTTAAIRRAKHNKRALRKMRLANLKGEELQAWLDDGRQQLVKQTEGMFQLLNGLRVLMDTNAKNPAGSLEELDELIASERRKVDNLSAPGPNGSPMPFARITQPLHLDAERQRILRMSEVILRVAHTRIGEIQEALEKCWPRWLVKRKLRHLGEMRAGLATMVHQLRDAIDL